MARVKLTRMTSVSGSQSTLSEARKTARLSRLVCLTTRTRQLSNLQLALRIRRIWTSKSFLLPPRLAHLLAMVTHLALRTLQTMLVLAGIAQPLHCSSSHAVFNNGSPTSGAPAEDFDVWDVGVHPNCYNSKPNKWNDDTVYKHQRPRTSAWFFVMSIFILADHSSAFR